MGRSTRMRQHFAALAVDDPQPHPSFFTPEPATVTKHPNTHPINSSTSPATARVLPEEGRRDTRATTPKDTMMRQTKGRVAALTVAVFCVLGLIWIPHQALSQG